MRVAIVAPSSVPYVIGGAESFWWGLLEALNNQKNVQADLIKLPCSEDCLISILRSYKAFAHLDLSHFDCVISTKYPAWAICHPHHLVYMQHPCRIVYDQYDPRAETQLNEDILLQLKAFAWPTDVIAALVEMSQPHPVLLPISEPLTALIDLLIDTCERYPEHVLWQIPGPLSRAIIRLLDQISLSRSRIERYMAISQTVARREGYFPRGVTPEVLYHPTSLKGFENEAPKHIFSASRLVADKRIDLLIQAYRAAGVDYPLKIAGTGPMEDSLRALAEDLPTVEFVGRLSNQDLVKAYSEALFVPFIPMNEDYGLITVEALSARKPVLTVSDAGGPVELIVNQKNGWVVSPTCESLAVAIQSACNIRHPIYEQMNCQASLPCSFLSWGELAQRLLEKKVFEIRSSQHIKVGMVYSRDTVHARASFSGLQAWAELMQNQLDVYLCGLSSEVEYVRQFESHTGVHETLMPLSARLKECVFSLAQNHQEHAMSVALAQHAPSMMPALMEPLFSDRDVIIFSDPALLPVLSRLQKPLVFFPQHLVMDAKSEYESVDAWLFMKALEKRAYEESDGLLLPTGQARKCFDAYGARRELAFFSNRVALRVEKFHRKEMYCQEWGVSRPCVLYYLPTLGIDSQQLESLLKSVRALPEYDFVAVSSSLMMQKLPKNLIFLPTMSSSEQLRWLKIARVAVILEPHPKLFGVSLTDVLAQGLMVMQVLEDSSIAATCGIACIGTDGLIEGLKNYLNLAKEQQYEQWRSVVQAAGDEQVIGNQMRCQLDLMDLAINHFQAKSLQ